MRKLVKLTLGLWLSVNLLNWWMKRKSWKYKFIYFLRIEGIYFDVYMKKKGQEGIKMWIRVDFPMLIRYTTRRRNERLLSLVFLFLFLTHSFLHPPFFVRAVALFFPCFLTNIISFSSAILHGYDKGLAHVVRFNENSFLFFYFAHIYMYIFISYIFMLYSLWIYSNYFFFFFSFFYPGITRRENVIGNKEFEGWEKS